MDNEHNHPARHHKYGPSKYNHWCNCIQWEESDRCSLDAERGRKIHEELSDAFHGKEPSSPAARWASSWVKGTAGQNCIFSELEIHGAGKLDGVFGTCDVVWYDDEKILNIADLKSFSDGSEDSTPQLMGYVALLHSGENGLLRLTSPIAKIHILHGGIMKVETKIVNKEECYRKTVDLIERVKNRDVIGEKPRVCKSCQYCAKASQCPAVAKSIATVSGGQELSFDSLPLAKKLLVCGVVEKIIKRIRDEAKEEAKRNGGVLEADGVRYEIKVSKGTAKMKGTIVDIINAERPEGMVWMSNAEVLELSSLPKTKLVDKLKALNKGVMKVRDIEEWVGSLYDNDIKESLVRV